MTRPLFALVISAFLTITPQVAGAQNADAATTALSALRSNWQNVVANITKAAEELSDDDYAYRPVGTVRTFGQMIGHIAGSQLMMCAAALGDTQPAEDAVEKAATTKVALVRALKESSTYCDRAYTQNAGGTAAAVEMFGSPSTRFGALALNAIHDGEHYGNIITYMRMRGMVPPSSKR